MTDQEIIQLVESDEEAHVLMLQGADDRCADRLSEIAPKVLQDFYVTELTLFNLFRSNLTLAESLIKKIEDLSLSSTNPHASVFKRIVKWLGPGSQGVNIGSEETMTILSSSVEDGGLGLDDYSLQILKQAVYAKQIFKGSEISRIFRDRRTLQ